MYEYLLCISLSFILIKKMNLHIASLFLIFFLNAWKGLVETLVASSVAAVTQWRNTLQWMW